MKWAVRSISIATATGLKLKLKREESHWTWRIRWVLKRHNTIEQAWSYEELNPRSTYNAQPLTIKHNQLVQTGHSAVEYV